jgi:hypothetical protein
MRELSEIPGKARGKVPANKRQKPQQYCSKCLEIIVVK